MCPPYGHYCPIDRVGALRGPEYFNGQAGLALAFDRFSVGPYFAASYGVYGTDAGRSLTDGQTHWWLNVGIRFTVTS